MTESQPTKKIMFDPTVNLGHLITFVGFIIAGFAAWSTLDKRITVVETQRAHQAQVDVMQDQRALDSYVALRETLARLDRQVERLANQLDKK